MKRNFENCSCADLHISQKTRSCFEYFKTRGNYLLDSKTCTPKHPNFKTFPQHESKLLKLIFGKTNSQNSSNILFLKHIFAYKSNICATWNFETPIF